MGKSLIRETGVVCFMGKQWVEREKRWLIIENVWCGNPKKKKKIILWQGNDVAQLKCDNNKYYALIDLPTPYIMLCMYDFFLRKFLLNFY